jgi:hypothetical protein
LKSFFFGLIKTNDGKKKRGPRGSSPILDQKGAGPQRLSALTLADVLSVSDGSKHAVGLTASGTALAGMH